MALPAGVLVTSVMFVYNWNVYILVSKHLITVLFFYFFFLHHTETWGEWNDPGRHEVGGSISS